MVSFIWKLRINVDCSMSWFCFLAWISWRFRCFDKLSALCSTLVCLTLLWLQNLRILFMYLIIVHFWLFNIIFWITFNRKFSKFKQNSWLWTTTWWSFIYNSFLAWFLPWIIYMNCFRRILLCSRNKLAHHWTLIVLDDRSYILNHNFTCLFRSRICMCKADLLITWHELVTHMRWW